MKEEEFKIGNIIELICNSGVKAKVGAKAEVCKYDSNCSHLIGVCKRFKCCNDSPYINIKWIDDKSCGQMDGCYYKINFILANSIKNVESAPKNNDGREICFWCPGEKTQKRGGGIYDVCPKCGK